MAYLWYVVVVWAVAAHAQDLNPCTTEDKPDASFFFKNARRKKYNCAEFVERDRCLCTMDAVRDSCCASCEPYKNKLAECPCQDLLTKDNKILALHVSDNSTADEIPSCSKLVNHFGQWCDRYEGDGNLCCQSCKWQMSSCVDDQSSFKIKKNSLTCTEFIAADRCNCFIRNYGRKCCHSCQFIDSSSCKCTDSLSPKNQAEIINPRKPKELIDTVNRCELLVQKYPEACKLPDVSGIAGQCCKSCEMIDTSCQDLVNKKLPIFLKSKKGRKATITSCSQLKKDYPELCKKYGDRGCCKACRGVDTDCLDTRLTRWIVGEESHDCPRYIALDPCQCDKNPIGEQCCKSCQKIRAKAKNIAHCCTDDPDYRMVDSSCANCSCNQLITLHNIRFARKICKNDTDNVTSHCCHTCRTAGVFVPAS